MPAKKHRNSLLAVILRLFKGPKPFIVVWPRTPALELDQHTPWLEHLGKNITAYKTLIDSNRYTKPSRFKAVANIESDLKLALVDGDARIAFHAVTKALNKLKANKTPQSSAFYMILQQAASTYTDAKIDKHPTKKMLAHRVELEQLQSRLTQISTASDKDKTTQAANLEQNLQAWGNEKGELQNKLATAEEALTMLQEKDKLLQENKVSIHFWMNEDAEHRKTIAIHDETIKNLGEQLSKQGKELAETKEKLTTAIKNNMPLRKKNERLEKENIRLEKKLTAEQERARQVEEALNEQLSVEQLRVKQAEQALLDLQAKQEQIQKLAEEAKLDLLKAEELRTKNNVLKEALDKVSKQLETAEKEAKLDLLKAEELRAKNDELMKELDKVSRRLEITEKELQQKKISSEAMGDIRKNINDLVGNYNISHAEQMADLLVEKDAKDKQIKLRDSEIEALKQEKQNETDILKQEINQLKATITGLINIINPLWSWFMLVFTRLASGTLELVDDERADLESLNQRLSNALQISSEQYEVIELKLSAQEVNKHQVNADIAQTLADGSTSTLNISATPEVNRPQASASIAQMLTSSPTSIFHHKPAPAISSNSFSQTASNLLSSLNITLNGYLNGEG